MIYGGAQPFGTIYFGGQLGLLEEGGGPSTEVPAWKVVIAGLDRTDFVDLSSLEIEEQLNGLNNCSLRLNDLPIGQTVQASAPIYVYVDQRVVFGGFVETIDVEVAINKKTQTLSLDCHDWNALCDRHIVDNKFDTANQTLYDIVYAIVHSYSGDPNERLADDGVVFTSGFQQGGGQVPTWPRISTVVFSDTTVTDAFNALADLTGYWWDIDYNKQLRFVDPSKLRTPFDLDESTFSDFNATLSTTRQDYRNIQRLIGGKDTTDPLTQEFTGDGEATSFTLRYPLAIAPTIVKQPGAVAQTATIQDVDDTGDWYYQLDSDKINQNTDNTELTGSESIEVTYRGFFPIEIIARNDSEIDRLAALEGTSGATEIVDSDTSINDADLAEERVNGLLRRYGRIPPTIRAVTFTRGLSPGSLCRVVLPEYGIDRDMLVDQVTTTFHGENENLGVVAEYQATLVDSERQESWVDFFRRLATKGRPFRFRENDKVLILRHATDVLELTDALNFDAALGHYYSDISGWDIVGAPEVGLPRVRSITDSTVIFWAGPAVGTPRHVDLS